MTSLKRCFLMGVMMALGAGIARPDSPRFVTYQLDRTFVSPSFSAFCGFQVDITQVGPLKATVFYDASGAQIIREIDTQPGFTVKVSSPVSGKSFSFPFATAFRFDY